MMLFLVLEHEQSFHITHNFEHTLCQIRTFLLTSLLFQNKSR